MTMLRIVAGLFFCIYMLAWTIVNESLVALLFGVLVLVLGKALCKHTNWMDEEGDET